MVLCGTHVAEAKGLLRTLQYSLDAVPEIVEMLDSALLMLREAPTEEREKERLRKEKYRRSLEKKKKRRRPRDTTGQGRDSVGVEGVVVAEAEEEAAAKKNGRASVASQVQQVWDHYRTLRPKTRRKSLRSGTKEYNLIVARLKEYTVADLCLCMDGYESDGFWNGKSNDRNYKWEIDMVFAKGTNVDRGIALAENPRGNELLTRQAQSNIEAVIELTDRAGI